MDGLRVIARIIKAAAALTLMVNFVGAKNR